MPGWLKRLFLGDCASLPMWVPVGHAEPEKLVSVFLEGLGAPLDVTCNNVMVDLWPLLVAISLPGEGLLPRLEQSRLALVLREPQPSGKELGRVGLRVSAVIALPPHHIYLFKTTGCVNHCLPALRRRLTHLHERLRLLLDRNPHNEKMTPSEQFSNWLLYFSPRRVALVSFGDARRGNIFPMDLIGPTDSPYYLLSLSRKRPALPLITESRKLAVSTLPPGYKSVAFALGRNHRAATTDWKDVPFETAPSPTFGIPVPRDALSVREVSLHKTHEVASHVILVTSTTRLERWQSGPELCHVHRIYQHDLLRRGRGLDSCPERVVLAAGEFYRKRRFGPEAVNRGAVLLECEWCGGVFESGTMLGGFFRGGEVRGGTFSGAVFWDGDWRGGTWLGGFDRHGRYRPRTDHPPHS